MEPLIHMQGLVETIEFLLETHFGSLFSVTVHPDIKRTIVSMSEWTVVTDSLVANEVLDTGLIEIIGTGSVYS